VLSSAPKSDVVLLNIDDFCQLLVGWFACVEAVAVTTAKRSDIAAKNSLADVPVTIAGTIEDLLAAVVDAWGA